MCVFVSAFPPAALALGVLSGCRSRRLALQRLRSRRRAAHAARGVRPLGRRERRGLRALARDPRGALAGPARPAAGRDQPRQVPLRGARPRDQPARSTRAASRASTASGRAPTRRSSCGARSPSRCASRSPRVRSRSWSRSATGSRRSTRSSRWWWIREPPRWSGPRRPRAPACGRCRRAARRATRSTCCCSATATPPPRWTSGTPTPKRLTEMLFAARRSRERRADFNVWAIDAAGGRERRVASLGRASIAARRSARPTTRSARSATCCVDERALARARGRGALRVRGDRGQRPHLRRRRHPQPVRDGRRGQRVHAATSSCTSSATTSPASPTSTTPPTSPTPRAASASSRGSPTSRRDPKAAKWADLIPPGTAAAHALAEGGVRGDRAGDPGPASRGSVPRAGPRRRWRRCSARSSAHRASCSARPARPGGRRLRGRQLRGEGLLPPARRLHHVHAQRRGLLPRVPARARAGDRPVRRALTGGGPSVAAGRRPWTLMLPRRRMGRIRPPAGAPTRRGNRE